jgi:hypothetical protein
LVSRREDHRSRLPQEGLTPTPRTRGGNCSFPPRARLTAGAFLIF